MAGDPDKPGVVNALNKLICRDLIGALLPSPQPSAGLLPSHSPHDCKAIIAAWVILRLRRGRRAPDGIRWSLGKCCGSRGVDAYDTVPAPSARPRGRSVLHSESTFCGGFGRARGALTGPNRRFPARAGVRDNGISSAWLVG